MSSKSPTAMTLTECRRIGMMADVVERWIAHTRRRKDVFGFGDVLAVGCGTGALLIQATSGDNGSSRVKKIVNDCRDEALVWLRAGNRIEVWAWRKYAKPLNGERRLWRPRVIQVTEGVVAEG